VISEIDFTEHKIDKLTNELFFKTIIDKLEKYFNTEFNPSVSRLKEEGANPFEVLISTIISARTKDEVTYPASVKLFKKANSPEKLAGLTEKQVADLIYPAGFYKNKAKHIIQTSKIIVEKYGGKVPDRLEDLLNLPGVGRKTANLVLAVGFNKDGLCVDTHVNRISNRLGIIKTKNPFETEMQLRVILPKKFWETYNRLFVLLGQKVCKARKPNCDICPISDNCKKII